MALETLILPINPDTFEYQTYSTLDEQLIVQSELDTVFSASTDYIEYYIYDQNKTQIYPLEATPLTSYDIREGDVILNPSSNLESFGFDLGVYNISYSFYRKRAASSITENYYIAAISSDRTEIRLDSNVIENSAVVSSANDFIQYRESAEYFVDFYLNFGNNETVIANNLKLEIEEGIDPTLLIKLYEPLPLNFDLKSELWVVELLSAPQAYQVDFPFEPIIEDDFIYIAGPNYNLDIIGQNASPGEQFSYNTLINSDLTSSINQIQSLLNEKEIDININYEKFSNFVNFSSAETRLDNFYQKVGLIESASNQLSTFLNQIATNTIYTPAYSSSKASLTGQIDTIIKNFDGYEYFLYFNSGSTTSYPKSTSTPPFILYPTGSVETQAWLSSSKTLSSAYDQENRDWLYWSIPEYLREDPLNRNYELFVDMVAQYYDNVWVYTKDITNKFDADNRLDYGISKDLVSDAIKDFAIKLYSNNFNTDDLFTAFLGLTPSGSAFPFPNITGSIGGAVATPTGFEYVDTKISASNDIVPLDDVNKRVYKRIYHNIPYLLKTKGTIAGIRALITSYGIPDTILRISEFGGKDRNESQDYDLKQNVFNYAFDTGASATNFVSSSLQANTKFPVQSGNNKARTIQLRFKSPTLPLPVNNVASNDIRPLQSLWSTDEPSGNLVLEYNGAGLISGSYSGSIASPYDTYGTLKWIPAEGDNPDLSASVYLPFFNGDWWSVQMNVDNSVDASLYAANEIDGKIGFNESSSTVGFDDSFYFDARIGYLNKDTNVVFDDGTTYTPFSGSFQELRYYVNEISQSHFYDYTVNPYSNEGNGINSTPDQQFFRAALGTQLDTGSRTSIHPRVTGSAVQITQSFATNSEFYINSSSFITNVEDIFQDQAPVGIKNRITDKIQLEKVILAEAPYGFPNPSASVPEISSVGNYTQTISPMESMQQTSFTSQSITPNIDYLEVAFSPSNQINDDINAQLGYFNLGEYIGDPRFFSSSLRSYPDLDRLRDQYFEKYMSGYDVVDFVRLIKFFDNSLFKMIKDFTPARTSLASGVVVKQHLLERNRQRTALVTSSLHDYEGLVVNLPKNYSSGSTDFPQYSTSGSALYKFSGGPGGSFNKFNGLQTYISGSNGSGPDNRFGVTQSWQDGNDGSILNTTNFNQSSSQFISGSYLGPRTWVKNNQDEFYTGIFSGSMIIATTQSLNPGCDPYLNANDTPIVFKPIFFTLNDNYFATGPGAQSVVTGGGFLDINNVPPSGYAWIASKITNVNASGVFNASSGEQQVVAIKLSQDDTFGTEIINYLDDFDNLRIVLPDASIPYNSGAVEYIITGRTIYADHAVLFVSKAPTASGNNFPVEVDGIDYFAITSSISGGSMQWSLTARTGYTSSILNSESADNTQQGIFCNINQSLQEQNIFYWDSGFSDALGFFNTGSPVINTQDIIDTTSLRNSGNYTIPYTPNIPWAITASITYSGSLNPNASVATVDNGTYHSASLYQGGGLVNQNFILGADGVYFARVSSAYDSIALAVAGGDLSTADPSVYQEIAKFGIGEIFNSPFLENSPTLLNLVPNKFYKFSTLAETLQASNIANTSENTPLTNATIGTVSISYLLTDLGTVSGEGTGASATAALISNISGEIEFLLIDDIGTGTYNKNSTLTVTAADINSLSGAPFGTSVTGTDCVFILSKQNFTIAQVFATLGTNGMDTSIAFGAGEYYPTLFRDAVTWLATDIPTLFRPAPKFVTELGTIAFNNNSYNSQIPGNSGSGIDMNEFGGHSKIKVAGTASMDWTFPTLTLAGVDPGLSGGGSPTFVPFSGSDAADGNSDFTSSLNPGSAWTFNTITWANFTGQADGDYGQTRGGEIAINLKKVGDKIGQQTGTGDEVESFDQIPILVDWEMTSDSTSNAYQVHFVWKFYRSGAINEPWALMTGGGLTAVNGAISAQNQVRYINLNNTPPVTGTDQYILVRALVKNDRSDGANFNYKITENVVDIRFQYSNVGSSPGVNLYFPTTGYLSGWGAAGGYYQGSTTNDAGTISGSAANSYSTATVDVYLKRTGSEGDLIITGSVYDGVQGGYQGAIHSGSIISFTDVIGTISNNYEYDGTDNTSASTRNAVGDMYYVEYSMSNFTGGVLAGIAQTEQAIDFQTDSDESIIYITQSAVTGFGTGTFNATGSFNLRHQNLDSLSTGIGNIGLSLPFNAENSVNTVELSGLYEGPFLANDSNRFTIALNKVDVGSGIVIQDVRVDLFPANSIWSPITGIQSFTNFKSPINTNFIVPTFYGQNVMPFNLMLDCQPLLNNYSLGRPNPYIMKVDYNNESGPIVPVNFLQILSGSAVRSTVPESNYTQLASKNIRYDGVKSTTAQINKWNIGDTGTLGKYPNVELRDAYFGYFNDLEDPYPNINGLTRANINYLIDESGNALPPSLKDQLSIDTFKSVFPTTTTGRLAVKKGSGRYKALGEPSAIKSIMQYVTPICYSQISGDNYTNAIPLSGSGYISKYDNDDATGINFATFQAAGTSSFANTTTAVQSVNYIIAPTGSNTSIAGAFSPYTASTGEVSYPSPSWGSNGDDLNNEQIVSIQTSVVTSYVSEKKRVRDELKLQFKMKIDGAVRGYNLEKIDCKVYSDDGNVYLLKDVTQYGWFDILNVPKWRSLLKPPSFDTTAQNRWEYSLLPITSYLDITIDWEMNVTLFDLGLVPTPKPKNDTGILALEWIFTANSGKQNIVVDNKITWEMSGSFSNARRTYQQGLFFPISYTGAYTPTTLTGIGVKDYLLASANSASAPYWQFSGSSQTIIEMSSSNFNEAYGTSYYQGDLPYNPGFSEYFPGNVEPVGTNFDEITLPLEIKENDEIRFGNNENFTYRVLEVFSPSENISYALDAGGNSIGIGKVKLRLSGRIPSSVNKDFFVVRRTIPSPNSLYLDTPFPYGILTSGSISKVSTNTGSNNFGNSGSFLKNFDAVTGNYTASVSIIESDTTPGILYPDFPTEYLLESASMIVNDLITKRIIES